MLVLGGVRMAEVIFWISFAVVVYTYAGYPIAVFCIGRIKDRRLEKSPMYRPRITILTAAYNEVASIGKTIENKLRQNYPQDKLDLIVISDESTDGTDAIVERYAQQTNGRVKLIRQSPRQGKTAALNMAVSSAAGDILVFSDANSIYESDTISCLVENFHDAAVGYVTGKMVYTNGDGKGVGDGCSAYMKYENFLRAQETKVGSIVGVDGGVDAMRKNLFRPMRADQLPDFILPLSVVEQGYRVVYEARAIVREESLNTAADEYRMRVRVSLRALWALFDMRHLLGIGADGWFAWQLLSHKVLRYTVFIFIGAAYLSSAYLAFGSAFYLSVFLSENILLLASFAGYWQDRNGGATKIFYLPYYFALINIAAAMAFVKFLKREKQTVWKPRTG